MNRDGTDADGCSGRRRVDLTMIGKIGDSCSQHYSEPEQPPTPKGSPTSSPRRRGPVRDDRIHLDSDELSGKFPVSHRRTVRVSRLDHEITALNPRAAVMSPRAEASAPRSPGFHLLRLKNLIRTS